MALALLLFSGCATERQETSNRPLATPLVWPAPPLPPRIAYVRSIRHPGDVGIKPSGFTRLVNWISGDEKGREPLLKPFGLGLDENDNLCLTDTGANAVCFFDRAQKTWKRWTKIEKLTFHSPVAVAKRNGIFFVADSGLAAILAFSEAGKLRFKTTNHLERPSGLVLVGEQLFVADSQRHCIIVFDLQGNYVSEFGRRGTSPGEFNFPTHITADMIGHLLVTDSMNSRVQVLDRHGQSQGQIGSMGNSSGQFSRPKGVAVDALGRIYVVDGLFANVQIFQPDGKLLLPFGEGGSQPGEFWLPNGIAITKKHEIYVADSYNRRLQVFQYMGEL